MKIEPGKFFKLRNGQKARIYAVDVGREKIIHGAYCDDNGFMLAWYSDGRTDRDGIDSVWDIVSEWVEPKPKKRREIWIKTDSGMSATNYKLDQEVMFFSPNQKGWIRFIESKRQS